MGKVKVQQSLDDFMRQKQKWIAAVLLVLCAVGVFIFHVFNQNSHAPLAPKKAKIEFSNPLKTVTDSIWREQQENRIAATNQKATSIQAQLFELKQETKSQSALLQAQSAELNRLRDKLSEPNSAAIANQIQTNTAKNISGPHVFGAPGAGIVANNSPYVSDAKQIQLQSRKRHIKINRFTLTPHIPANLIHTDLNYIPAGAFVRAVLLSGLDAPTGVNNQAEPVPVLLRLVDFGKLPNDAHSYIKSCFMTAAGIGNISSERAYIRTERMSCTLKDGRILDVPIEATIVGPDGKDGVRGPVIWREQAMVERAALAGLLSGFSNALSQAYTLQTATPFGVASAVNNKHLFQYGLANGAGNGMDKLADYFIKRAESYQPVVEVSAGVSVDVMFLKGVSLSLRQADNLNGNTRRRGIGSNHDVPHMFSDADSNGISNGNQRSTDEN